MSSEAINQEIKTDLRLRALAKLTGRHDPGDSRANSSAALGVLFELASSPATTSDALALLHELQVHQVEIDMQDEELQRSCADLETKLARQIQLYDLAPFGYLTIDANSVLREMNLAGARLLGSARDTLLGRSLDTFLSKESGRALHAMLARIVDANPAQTCDLQLTTLDGEPLGVHVCATADAARGRFLVAIVGPGG